MNDRVFRSNRFLAHNGAFDQRQFPPFLLVFVAVFLMVRHCGEPGASWSSHAETDTREMAWAETAPTYMIVYGRPPARGTSSRLQSGVLPPWYGSTARLAAGDGLGTSQAESLTQ